MAKKVLLVEENSPHSLKTRQLLEKKNYEVLVAGNGSEGLNKASQLRPDLILLDTYLPDQSGYELCKQLKHNLQLRNIPVIVVSQESKLQSMVTAYEMGADYYVMKNEEGQRVLGLLVDAVFTRLSRRVLQFS
ncbi:MAG TPA: response regulator [Chloroflexia bacterium]|nr:response regulator [Chloroflexia bacterium]